MVEVVYEPDGITPILTGRRPGKLYAAIPAFAGGTEKYVELSAQEQVDREAEIAALPAQEAARTEARKNALATNIDAGDDPRWRAVFRVLLSHENRIRDLEARPNVTAQQFKDALRSLMD